MPATVLVRRSRRLSKQPPCDPSESGLLGWEQYSSERFKAQCPTHNAASTRYHPYREAGLPRSPSPAADSSPCSDIVSGDDEETGRNARVSHSRRKGKDHIPRPPNAFILFRSELWAKEKIKGSVERDHRQISRIAGHVWNGLSDEQKKPYVHKAMLALEEHKKKYPKYRFSPVSKVKDGRRRNREDIKAQQSRSKALARLLKEGVEGDRLAKLAERMDEWGNFNIADPVQEKDLPNIAIRRQKQISSRNLRPSKHTKLPRKPRDIPAVDRPPARSPQLALATPSRSHSPASSLDIAYRVSTMEVDHEFRSPNCEASVASLSPPESPPPTPDSQNIFLCCEYRDGRPATEDAAVIPKASADQHRGQLSLASPTDALSIPSTVLAVLDDTSECFESIFSSATGRQDDVTLSMDDIFQSNPTYNDVFQWMFTLPTAESHAVQAPEDSEFSYFDYDKASS